MSDTNTSTTTTTSDTTTTPTTTTSTDTSAETTTTSTTSTSSTTTSSTTTTSTTSSLTTFKPPTIFRSPCFQAVVEDSTTTSFTNQSADFSTTSGAHCVNFLFPQNASKAVFDIVVSRDSENVYTVKGNNSGWYFIIFLLCIFLALSVVALLSARKKLKAMTQEQPMATTAKSASIK